MQSLSLGELFKVSLTLLVRTYIKTSSQICWEDAQLRAPDSPSCKKRLEKKPSFLKQTFAFNLWSLPQMDFLHPSYHVKAPRYRIDSAKFTSEAEGDGFFV